MAILPFENLTGDASLDWAGPAAASIFANGITASTHVLPMVAGDTNEAALTQPDEVLQGYFERRGDQLRFYVTVRNQSTRKMVAVYQASGPAAYLPATMEALERETKERIRPFSTTNPEAVREWGNAMLTTTLEQRAAALERAIADDPNFASAYVELAQVWRNAGNRDNVANVLARAKVRIATFPDVDRARLELIDSELTGNAIERRRSLLALSRLISTDPKMLEALADFDFSHRQFTSAAELYKSALAITPENAAVLNQLGYTEAYNGRLDEARSALERYRALDPQQPNSLDSLGEAHFLLGHFDEAEKYFLDAHSRQPAFLNGLELVKAAQCRMMRGDLSAADNLFGKYMMHRQAAHDPLATIRYAQWLYLTGRREQAEDNLQKLAAQTGDLGSYAAAQLSLWAVDAGKRDQAQALAARAAASAVDASMRNLAALCSYFAAPSGAPPGSDLASAFALAFSGRFAEAAPLLKALYERTNPSTDGQIRSMYASALVGAGRTKEAAPLIEHFVMPFNGQDSPLASITFPRFVSARASVLDALGRTQEAQAAHALARTLNAGQQR
jgi:tetratricopeptide (TPR) repeat protein